MKLKNIFKNKYFKPIAVIFILIAIGVAILFIQNVYAYKSKTWKMANDWKEWKLVNLIIDNVDNLKLATYTEKDRSKVGDADIEIEMGPNYHSSGFTEIIFTPKPGHLQNWLSYKIKSINNEGSRVLVLFSKDGSFYTKNIEDIGASESIYIKLAFESNGKTSPIVKSFKIRYNENKNSKTSDNNLEVINTGKISTEDKKSYEFQNKEIASILQESRENKSEDSNKDLNYKGQLYETTLLKEKDKKSPAKYQTKIYNQPVNYLDANGDWQTINSDIKRIDKDFAFASLQNAFKVYFSEYADEPYRLEFNNRIVEFRFNNINPNSKAIVDGNKITYPDIIKNIDLVYKVSSNNLKEEIIVKEITDISEISYQMKIKNVYFSEDNNGNVNFYDNNNGQLVWTIQKPFAKDYIGQTAHGSVRINQQGTDVYKVDLLGPYNQINDPRVVLPVVIDPTINVLVGGATYVDGFVEYYPTVYTNTSSTANTAKAGVWSDAYYSYTDRAYFDFDTSPVLDGATITDTVLNLYVVSTSSAPTHNIVPMPYKGYTRTTQQIYSDAGTTTNYVAGTAVFNGAGGPKYKSVDLGATADTNLQNGLSNNYFTVGLNGTGGFTVFGTEEGSYAYLTVIWSSGCGDWTINATSLFLLSDVTCTGTITLSGGSNLDISATSLTITAAGFNMASGTVYNSNATTTLNISGDITLSGGSAILSPIWASSTNFTINSGTSINVDGRGYLQEAGPGSINGGGSYGGTGGLAPGSSYYGSAIQSPDHGSGGKSSCGTDGSGGGKVRISASGTFTNNGSISANGGLAGFAYGCASGSGGSIFVTTGAFAGNGSFAANGGNGENAVCVDIGWGHYSLGNNGGGGGRVYISYNTKTYTGTTYTANGGTGGTAAGGCTAVPGTAGTKGSVGFYDRTNNDLNMYAGFYFKPAETYSYRNIIANSASNIYFDGPVTINASGFALSTGSTWAGASSTPYQITINSSSTVDFNSTSNIYAGTTTISATYFNLSSNSQINANYRGYASNTAPTDTNKGSHGGHAAVGYFPYSNVYDMPKQPAMPGAGGVTGSCAFCGLSFGSGGWGGGVIRINITSSATINGALTANGEKGNDKTDYSYYGQNNVGGSGGAGGSIWVTAPTLTGSGSMVASGGAGGIASGGSTHNWGGNGGGGGRIYVQYNTSAFSGTKTAVGGAGGAASGPDAINGTAGAKGTIGFYDSTNNDLYIYDGWYFYSGDTNSYRDIIISSASNIYSNDGVSIVASRNITASGNNFWHGVAQYPYTSDDLSITANAISLSNTGIYSLENLTLDNGGNLTFSSTTISIAGSFIFNKPTYDLALNSLSSISSSATSTNASIVVDDLTLSNNSYINSNLQATSTNLTINNGSSILANGIGYPQEYGASGFRTPGAGGHGGWVYVCYGSGGGAGYGGTGGAGGGCYGVGGSKYGASSTPTYLGSGGGNGVNGIEGNLGASGGGNIRLNISNTLTNNGTISANGSNGLSSANGGGGGGSGGSIYINTLTFSGNGSMTANGGNGGNTISYSGLAGGGGGGGGRIAKYVCTDSYSGTPTVNGGAGGTGTGGTPVAGSGAVGTIYSQPTCAPWGWFDSVSQKTDGSGYVDISIKADDPQSQDTRAKIEYSAGATCSSGFSNGTLLGPATSDCGTAPDISTGSYQVGSGSGTRISTSCVPSTTVAFDWDSETDVGTVTGTYCLRLTVNNDYFDQLVPATTTVEINNTPTGYSASGTLTSIIFDTTGPDGGAAYNSIMWLGSLNSGFVGFQVATADSEAGPWTFYGSSGGPDSCSINDWYPSNPGVPVEIICAPQSHNNKRFFRYKVRLCSTSDCSDVGGSQSPVIDDIIVNWSP